MEDELRVILMELENLSLRLDDEDFNEEIEQAIECVRNALEIIGVIV